MAEVRLRVRLRVQLRQRALHPRGGQAVRMVLQQGPAGRQGPLGRYHLRGRRQQGLRLPRRRRARRLPFRRRPQEPDRLPLLRLDLIRLLRLQRLPGVHVLGVHPPVLLGQEAKGRGAPQRVEQAPGLQRGLQSLRGIRERHQRIRRPELLVPEPDHPFPRFQGREDLHPQRRGPLRRHLLHQARHGAGHPARPRPGPVQRRQAARAVRQRRLRGPLGGLPRRQPDLDAQAVHQRRRRHLHVRHRQHGGPEPDAHAEQQRPRRACGRPRSRPEQPCRHLGHQRR